MIFSFTYARKNNEYSLNMLDWGSEVMPEKLEIEEEKKKTNRPCLSRAVIGFCSALLCFFQTSLFIYFLRPGHVLVPRDINVAAWNDSWSDVIRPLRNSEPDTTSHSVSFHLRMPEHQIRTNMLAPCHEKGQGVFDWNSRILRGEWPRDTCDPWQPHRDPFGNEASPWKFCTL